MGATPELVARLRQGRRVSTVTGMLRQPNILRAVHGPGWALVGDAGYHRDAVTGHGLSDAYRDAELLAVALHRALAGADTALAGADTALAGADTALAGGETALAGYQRRRDQALREVFELTVALAAYPPVPEFVELQKQLARALDTEAADLAARSAPALACA